MLDISLITAALAGLLSFLSPCILPIVPFYLSYLAGTGAHTLRQEDVMQPQTWRRAVLSACAFSTGVITIFVLLGASATSVGLMLREYFDILRVIAGALLVLMGLHFLGILHQNITAQPSYGSAFVIGLAFAFGWTPCVGPVLSAILFTAGAQASAFEGAALLLAYGVGMMSPFVLAAVFLPRFMGWMARVRPLLVHIERIQGAILVIFGLLIATGALSDFAFWLRENISFFARIG